MRPNLLDWQWSDYALKHRHRGNLLLHIVAVPLCWLAVVGLSVAVVNRSIATAMYALIALVFSLIAQSRGHRREAAAPAPFSGASDFLTRFLAEQFVTFPRYVFSGNWWRAVREP